MVLRKVYDSIITDGKNTLDPSPQGVGKGALYNQRGDARFLHFKDADAWLDYSRQFGGGEPFAALIDHINDLTRAVALMRRFGPNPASMVEYLTQVIASEGAKVKLEQPNMFPSGGIMREMIGALVPEEVLRKLAPDILEGQPKMSVDASVAWAKQMLDGFYDQARGSGVPFSYSGEALGMFRDVQYGAKMGSAAIVHATTTMPIQAMGRALQGHSLLELPMDFIRGFSRGEAEHAGLILQDGMTWLESGAREQSAWLKARELTR